LVFLSDAVALAEFAALAVEDLARGAVVARRRSVGGSSVER